MSLIFLPGEKPFPTSYGYWVTSEGSMLYPDDPYERFCYGSDLENFGIRYKGRHLDTIRELRYRIGEHVVETTENQEVSEPEHLAERPSAEHA